MVLNMKAKNRRVFLQRLRILVHIARERAKALTEANEQIQKLGYALGYCKDEQLAKKGCKHRDSAPYDGEFKHPKYSDVQSRAQDVCTECGKISKWAKCDKNGRYTPKF